MSTAQQQIASPKQQFLDSFEREHATTLRVLRAYPADQLDLKPAPTSNSARQLIWTFVMEQALAQKALTTGFDWANRPAGPPPPPESLDELIAAFEDGQRKVVELVKSIPDEKLFGTVQFPVAPKTFGDVPIIQFLWFLLCDQIHHRGQLSVYLRIAGARVPSIYGPTADEPWL